MAALTETDKEKRGGKVKWKNKYFALFFSKLTS